MLVLSDSYIEIAIVEISCSYEQINKVCDSGCKGNRFGEVLMIRTSVNINTFEKESEGDE